MNLVIDQGNTLTKLALFEQDEMINYQITPILNKVNLENFIAGVTIKKGILSSVTENLETELLKKYNLLSFSHTTPLPLAINYKTPQTLGLDRIAAAVGVLNNIPKTEVLVIDMGTCITYDFITANNEYLGGGISPGFEMRFKALNQFTNKLPLVNFNENELQLIGNTTETSIISGVYNGMKSELQGIINTYMQQYSTLKIVITGGDAKRFDLAPKNRIFADEFLVLKGLNEILNYNDTTE